MSCLKLIYTPIFFLFRPREKNTCFYKKTRDLCISYESTTTLKFLTNLFNSMISQKTNDTWRKITYDCIDTLAEIMKHHDCTQEKRKSLAMQLMRSGVPLKTNHLEAIQLARFTDSELVVISEQILEEHKEMEKKYGASLDKEAQVIVQEFIDARRDGSLEPVTLNKDST